MLNSPKYITPILKLTEGCNYHCYFCRYANHPPQTNSLTLESAKLYLNQVITYNLNHQHASIKIIFHGGEPLLWGIDNFRELMDFEKKVERNIGIKFINSIQTNGYLINDDWTSLFKENQFQVGISLDGPPELNGHYGNSGNKESVRTVMNHIHKLSEEHIPVGILSVITSKHMGKENEFYNYWIDNNIKNIGLCYCYNPEDGETVDAHQLSNFLIRLFDLYFWGKSTLNIREFNNAIAKLLNKETEHCMNACRKKCGQFLTITGDGSVIFCDELEKGKHSIVGNLNIEQLEQIVCGENYRKLIKKSYDIIANKCYQCPVYSICGAGCRRNDSPKADYNFFCDTYINLYNHIQKTINSI